MIARRRLLAAGAAVLALPRLAWASAGRITFSGALEQGALVLGKAEPGARVTVDGDAVRVSPTGEFAFGFSYNRTRPAHVVARFADGAREARDVRPQQRSYEVQRINGLPQKFVTPSKKISPASIARP